MKRDFYYTYFNGLIQSLMLGLGSTLMPLEFELKSIHNELKKKKIPLL